MKSVILCAKRTGSTFLQECFNSHPDFVCYDELFMRKVKKRRGMKMFNAFPKWTIDQYLDWIYSQKENVCFRLMYPHFEKKKHKIFEYLKGNKVKVIHLVRTDYLAKYISYLTKSMDNPEPMKVNVNDAIAKIKNAKSKDAQMKNLFKSLNTITIKYEEIIGKVEGEKENVRNYGALNIKSDQITYLDEKVNEKICKFLNIENKPMFCNVTKKNRPDYMWYIKNKKEVLDKLKQENLI